jgi:DNA-binding transcriptional ArsR family regulator
MAARRRQIKLTDPRTIRALSHPARIQVIEELFSGRVATSTELAELTGLTPSAMSYHLRALEKYKLVERDKPAGDARERPWRAAGAGISIESTPTRAAQAAAGLLTDNVFDTLRQMLNAYMKAEQQLAPEWRNRANFDSGVAYLTPEETRELIDALTKAAEPFRRRGRRPRSGTRRVRTSLLIVPEVD